MNSNTEREYWARVVQEVLDATGLSSEELAEKMGVSVRQISNWKAGQRPTGMVAIRFYAYRKEILEIGIVMHCSATEA